ncbi:MAG: biotin transporter BioY, partial [Selenomonadaceae bacterium]|nr:biotin transporter BioY [Selenomonadaceae bacterium]
NILIGVPLTYAGGLISMMLLLDVNFWQAMTMAVFPFIPGDIMKALAAAFLGVRINQALASRDL